MKALGAGVSAFAMLAYAGMAFAEPSVDASSAPANAHVVTVELADAYRIPVGDLYVSLADPLSTHAFANGDGSSLVFGHAVVAPPMALSLSTAPEAAAGDVTVVRSIAPGVALWVSSSEPARYSPAPFGTSTTGLAASDPYASLARGGTSSGVRIQLGDQLRLRFGIASRDHLDFSPGTPLTPAPAELFASMGNGFSAHTASASAEWQFAEWGGLAVTATQANERGTILGRAIAGPLAVSNGASTTALGVSARVGFGDGWVTTVAFNSGITHLDLNPGAFTDSVRTGSYGLALTKEDIFGNDVLGFSVSRPMQSGGVTFGPDAFGPRPRVPITALTGGHGAEESDVQMGYVTTFLDGALALQANAGVQMNANGQKGENDVSATAHAAFKF